MIARNYSEIRSHLKEYMDKACVDYETILITRKGGQNVVMVSEEAYNNLLENAYLRSDEANYDWLMESKRQAEQGKFSKHSLAEPEEKK